MTNRKFTFYTALSTINETVRAYIHMIYIHMYELYTYIKRTYNTVTRKRSV